VSTAGCIVCERLQEWREGLRGAAVIFDGRVMHAAIL
jgi:hypothetical protein